MNYSMNQLMHLFEIQKFNDEQNLNYISKYD